MKLRLAADSERPRRVTTDTSRDTRGATRGRMASDTTLIMVTHKLQLVNMVQRVIVVANGQMILDGPTADVMQRLRVAPTAQPAPNAGPAAAVGARA